MLAPPGLGSSASTVPSVGTELVIRGRRVGNEILDAVPMETPIDRRQISAAEARSA